MWPFKRKRSEEKNEAPVQGTASKDTESIKISKGDEGTVPASNGVETVKPRVKPCGCGKVHLEDEKCETDGKPEMEVTPPLDERDHKRLATNKYDVAKEKFKTSFVIQHIPTGKIAELRAASSVHAANMIGWRQRQVRVLETKQVNKEDKQAPVDAKPKVEIAKAEQMI